MKIQDLTLEEIEEVHRSLSDSLLPKRERRNQDKINTEVVTNAMNKLHIVISNMAYRLERGTL